jgi:hypothetical protein
VECKSSSEAKDEYVNRFVTGTTGQATWHTFPFNSEIDSTDSIQTQATIVQRPIDHTRECDESPLSPSLTSKLPPLDISSDEMQQLGYMADRDDYEKEYDNEAEKLVSQLTFNPEDDDAEIGLKLSLVDMYSRRLRERVRRKRVIRDYQLVSLFFKKDRNNISKDNGALTRKRFAAYEKELTERLRHLSPFHTAREHENFIRNFMKEKEIKFRIQELYKYRKNGITREEECIEYERHKLSVMRRNKMLSNQSAANSPDNVGNGGPSRSIPATIPEEGVLTSLDQQSRKPLRRPGHRRAAVTFNNGRDRDNDGDGDGDGSDRVDDGNLSDQRSTTRKRRRKRRVMLSRQKSHTPAVLYRTLQLKLRGITIRSAFITSNREAAENPGGTDAAVVDSSTNSRKRARLPKLIPASRKTKGYGRPIYC